MSALDTLERIVENDNLCSYPFRYCLVGEDKIPYTFQGARAHPNEEADFCSLEELSQSDKLTKYAGIGISIIASKICAIDVDKCFSTPFDINSADDRAIEIMDMFKDLAYIEFSFSGKGLRILFVGKDIQNYSEIYYIKNAKNKIEYYMPYGNARYVTLTGHVIFDNSLSKMTNLDTLYLFLNKYMLRPKTSHKSMVTCDLTGNNNLSIDELMKKVKSLCLTNLEFQDLWYMTEEEHREKLFCHILGKSKESEADFHLLALLYQYIVEDKEKLREVFERSDYFNNKDRKHLNKWYYGNYRYFEYIYSHL